MKCKILIIGEDYSNITDIYDKFEKIYEVLISSPIAADISSHINYFKPDMIMLSLEGVHDYVVDELKKAKASYSNMQGIPFAIVGNKDDLMWFEQQWAGLADLSIDTDREMVDIQIDIEVKIDKAAKKNAKASAQAAAAGRYTGTNKSMNTSQNMSANQSINTNQSMSVNQSMNTNQNMSANQSINANRNFNAGTGKKTILVVDDSPIMLKTIREQLREFYDVVIVTSGKLALKYLKDNRVDMMLLDYDMPEMSGLDVLKTMKADAGTKGIPVVFLTGVSERAKIAQALALGPQGYLLKPIDKDKLFAMIHKCIG